MLIVNTYEWGGKWIIQRHDGWDVDFGVRTDEPILDYYQERLENECFSGDSRPRWWKNFGPGIVAGFLGAQVFSDENTVWFESSTSTALEHIQPRFDPENYWWKWTAELTHAAVQRWNDSVTVAHTDLGGNMDILASLQGTQNLLVDLYDHPGEVERLVGEISKLWRS